MNYVLTPKEMQASEEKAFEKGLSPKTAMENAGEQVFLRAKQFKNVLVVCWCGNNGGDGFVCALKLIEAGIKVHVAVLGETERLSPHARFFYEKIKENIIPMSVFVDGVTDYDCVVDAIFGIGFHSEPKGLARTGIEVINLYKGRAHIISVDMPSGLNGATGEASFAVVADETVTFEVKKLGQIIGKGQDCCGKITVSKIGIDTVSSLTELEKADVKKMLPKLSATDHKGTRGHIGIIAGSFGMEGAALLASCAAIKTGVGKVSLCTDKNCAYNFTLREPEIMLSTQEKDEFIKDKDVVLFGSGSGRSQSTKEALEMLIENCTCPLVIDADGLYFLSKQMLTKAKCQITVTPHLKEASRLFNVPIDELIKKPVFYTEEFVKETGITVLLKSNYNIICSPEETYITQFGCSGMATAGSGDVLAGITAACIGLTKSSLFGACVASFIHGRAGNCAQTEKTVYGMVASDICNNIFQGYNELLDQ